MNNKTHKKTKFENLKQCSAVATLELNVGGEYVEQNSFEIKEEVGGDNNQKSDLESFMNMRPKIKMFEDLEGLEEDPKEKDKKEDEDDDNNEELIKDAEENNEALFPTSW